MRFSAIRFKKGYQSVTSTPAAINGTVAFDTTNISLVSGRGVCCRNDGRTPATSESPANGTLVLVDGAINIPSQIVTTPIASMSQTPAETVASSLKTEQSLRPPARFLNNARLAASSTRFSPRTSTTYTGTTNHDALFGYDEAGDVLHDDTGRTFTYDALSMTTGAIAPLTNETTGTAGETGVEVATAPAAGGAETVITAQPTFTGVANTALGIASALGPELNIFVYSRDFEENYGRGPTFSEMSHYLTTGDTRSEARIMFDLLRVSFAPI